MTDQDIIKLLQLYCPDVPLDRINDILYRSKEECARHITKQFMEEPICHVHDALQ
jgi:hypothetical protein